jgi:hypothetical protein
MHSSGSTACLRPACRSGESYKILQLKLQKAFLLTINNVSLTFSVYLDEYQANRTLANGLRISFAMDG